MSKTVLKCYSVEEVNCSYLSFFSLLAGIFGVKTFFGIPPRVRSLGPLIDGNLKTDVYYYFCDVILLSTDLGSITLKK